MKKILNVVSLACLVSVLNFVPNTYGMENVNEQKSNHFYTLSERLRKNILESVILEYFDKFEKDNFWSKNNELLYNLIDIYKGVKNDTDLLNMTLKQLNVNYSEVLIEAREKFQKYMEDWKKEHFKVKVFKSIYNKSSGILEESPPINKDINQMTEQEMNKIRDVTIEEENDITTKINKVLCFVVNNNNVLTTMEYEDYKNFSIPLNEILNYYSKNENNRVPNQICEIFKQQKIQNSNFSDVLDLLVNFEFK